jgi:hypothetical protein
MILRYLDSLHSFKLVNGTTDLKYRTPPHAMLANGA